MNLKKSLVSLAAFAAVVLGTSLSILAVEHPAIAQPVSAPRPPLILSHGYANATAGQTFATTSYADLAGASVSVPAASRVTASYADLPGTPSRVDRLQITWNADVTKATATTGTCAIYVNGAVVAATARTIDTAAKQGVIGGYYEVARGDNAAQTVKLQCKSGDTNTFTVANATFKVGEVIQ